LQVPKSGPLIQRGKLINPTWKRDEALQVAVEDARRCWSIRMCARHSRDEAGWVGGEFRNRPECSGAIG
jgi:hypothetical protein